MLAPAIIKPNKRLVTKNMKKANIRSEIVLNSRQLFQEQGYSATTVRQIAERTGCTAGSLYYFFEDGKAEILQEVIRSYGLDPVHNMAWVTETESLAELVDRLVVELPAFFQKVSKQLSWLALDKFQLPQNEKNMMRKFPLSLHEAILRGIRLHVADPEKSRQMSWIIYCSLYGYIEVFNKIGLVVAEEFCIKEMGETVKTAVMALAREG